MKTTSAIILLAGLVMGLAWFDFGIGSSVTERLSHKDGSGIVSKELRTNRAATSVSNTTGLSKASANLATATLAGGCFWCVEANFEEVPGVVEVISGYTGGHEVMPRYEDVARGRTHHTEAVQISYDPSRITFEGLLQVLWRTADPTDANGQYFDRGPQYRPGIYYHNEKQEETALAARKALELSGRYGSPVVIEIKPFTAFYKAEEVHQDYARKHPLHYGFYRYGSRRDHYQRHVWGEELEIDFARYRPQSKSNGPAPLKPMTLMPDEKTPGPDGMITPVADTVISSEPKMSYSKPSEAELKKRLTPLQYRVTQQEGTERPFDNEYWDNKKPGIYVDIASGEPLFSSLDKYKSGTGWPSFIKPLEQGNIVEKSDRSLFVTRTEIRSKHGDSHLGHVFNDGPQPTGQRYCMNSAALRFIPVEKLEAEGYGHYLKLFEKTK